MTIDLIKLVHLGTHWPPYPNGDPLPDKFKLVNFGTPSPHLFKLVYLGSRRLAFGWKAFLQLLLSKYLSANLQKRCDSSILLSIKQFRLGNGSRNRFYKTNPWFWNYTLAEKYLPRHEIMKCLNKICTLVVETQTIWHPYPGCKNYERAEIKGISCKNWGVVPFHDFREKLSFFM